MADIRKELPARLVQIQRAALVSIGDLGTAAVCVEYPAVMGTYALNAAAALEKAAAEIRAAVAKAEAEGQVNG